MAVHLYAVTAADAPPPSGTGRRGAPLRRVAGKGLAVIVSDVDPDAPTGAKDLMAHGRVLERYVERATVIPMRFGMVVADDDAALREVLADQAAMEHLLGVLDGAVQLTVQAFHEQEPALREVLRREPALVQMRDALATVPSALAQPRQVDLGRAVSAALEALAAEDSGRLLDALAVRARAVVVEEATAPREVLHAAFLVDRAGRDAFDEAVGLLREQVEDRLRLRYVGPQPPYSFVDPVRTGELVEAGERPWA